MAIISFLVFILSISVINSQQIESLSYSKGVILIDNDKAVKTEYKKFGNFYFLRNDKIGKKIPEKQVTGIVTDKFYDKIKNSSRFKSVAESFYLLSSGRSYQFFSENENSYEETFTVITKIVLIASTIYFYNSASSANRDLKNSYIGIDSDSRQSRFNREYQSFLISSSLTGLVFGMSAVHSFIRFGKNSAYNPLGIENRNYYELETLNVSSHSNLGERSFATGFTLQF